MLKHIRQTCPWLHAAVSTWVRLAGSRQFRGAGFCRLSYILDIFGDIFCIFLVYDFGTMVNDCAREKKVIW